METQKGLSLLRALLRRHTAHIRPRSRVQARIIRHFHNPADDPSFVSIVDRPPQIISTRKKHTVLGVLVLSVIPFTAFCLGTWQVKRLDEKTKLIAKFEDRLVRPPLPLPPRIDPSAISDFDYRRVYATGHLRHDKEMLIGPRTHDGTDGFLVITPLERRDGENTILINRGWISKEKRYQQDRLEGALPKGEVTISGLLREPWKKNFFTPDNHPEDGKFYFPDVAEMAQVSGAEPVWIEETMGWFAKLVNEKVLTNLAPDLLQSYDREAKGVPIGRAAEINLRNNHTQYIFTWYSLSAATSIMMWMVLKRKPSDVARRIRHSTSW